MVRNGIWVAFLLIVVGLSIWFVVKAGCDLIAYYQYNTMVSANIETWETRAVDADQYGIYADFSYEYEGKNYRSEGFIKKSYPNLWAAKAAQQDLEKIQKSEWNVWINPNAPENAVFGRQFPYKATLSAVVLIGLVIYFICLGLYAGVRSEQRRK